MPHFPKTLALILAGGKGSRLGVLTQQRSKPAMPFAGVYRLIDVSLSNLLHSGLSDVWIVEQYRPHGLNEHLANGRPWDLDRTRGGLRILPPYEGESKDKEGFAQGNAHAIYQHLPTIRQFDPDLILVLSADHIYRFDYSDLIVQHQETQADLTMVTTEVPIEEASRFGVVEADKQGCVTRFDYKPDEPSSGLVTAEIFLYTADVLLNTLDELAGDEEDEETNLEDYGHQLIPHLVEHATVRAFRHEGYWRDVGTVESYWQLHMDLLDEHPELRLDDPAWPIFTRDPQRLPARIHDGAHIENSLISPGCVVRGRVAHSVLGPGVIVEEGVEVRDSVILHDVRIERNAGVERTIVDENARIGRGARLGGRSPDNGSPKLTLVGQNVHVQPDARVHAGAEIDADSSEK